jgi:hypothetical protein
MNCLNAIGYGINKNVKVNIPFVTFDIPFDSQFFKQTTTDDLYDVYTIVGQSGTDGTSLTTWANKSVVATFTISTPKTIEYVCVGGGGDTHI